MHCDWAKNKSAHNSAKCIYRSYPADKHINLFNCKKKKKSFFNLLAYLSCSFVRGPLFKGVSFDKSTGSAGATHPFIDPWARKMTFAVCLKCFMMFKIKNRKINYYKFFPFTSNANESFVFISVNSLPATAATYWFRWFEKCCSVSVLILLPYFRHSTFCSFYISKLKTNWLCRCMKSHHTALNFIWNQNNLLCLWHI